MFYLIGLLILALGIIMNTKAGLGVSPIISVSYSISTIGQFNFGNTTLALYSFYLLAEIILHLFHARRCRKRGKPPERSLSTLLLLDILQFPLSLVFTRFLNWFGQWIPDLTLSCQGSFWGTMTGRILFLLVAIILTGVGSALSLNMRLIPNPGDGIVQAIADTSGKRLGFCKNLFDLGNVTVTLLVSLAASGHIIGIGLGTILSVLGVGRVIAVFHHFFFRPLASLTGLLPPSQASQTP
ncbi:MAG: DUF6198 family protein [Evtepia sp.]|uniref:DUF6198 family protein n=1 Tax=Evtepia sp. TaxID=2773933 RepID=UPI002A74C454|nr:DUF6198 family protein [Evtepia sp.]MDY3014031.1 DUF6198 family protein [Evtepia sp.]